MVLTCEASTRPQATERWQRTQLSVTAELPATLHAVLEAMTDEGYSSRDLFAVRLALEEALVNAIKHGHRNDPHKTVEVRFRVSSDHVLLEIEDEGPGFDRYQVPDPVAWENRERPSGRGLLLMRNYMTWMRFNERGNCVTLCKFPSEPLADYTLD